MALNITATTTDTHSEVQALPTTGHVQQSLQHLSTYRPDWSQLCQETILVSLKVKFWQGLAKLTPDMLGIDTDSDDWKAASQRIKLGSEMIGPVNELKALASKAEGARNIIKEFGVMFPGVGWVVPKTAWPLVHHLLLQKEIEFNTVMSAMVANRDVWVSELEQSLHAQFDAVCPAAEWHFGLGDRGLARDLFITRITSLVPSAENLRESAQWAVVLQNVKGLDAMAAAMDLTQLNDEVEQKKQQVEALKEEVGNLANLSQEERVRAEAALALEMERQQIELRDMEQRLEIERSIKEQMEKDNAEARQREIGDVLKGMSAKLRNILAEAAEHVASAIRKKEQVDERHVTQLRTAVEKIATLNFTGDQDIQALAAEVEKLTRTVPSHRDPARFREVLGNISAVVRADLALLGCDGAVTPSTEGLVEKAWKARAKLGMVDSESADAMSAAAPQVRRRRASAEPASTEEQVTPQPKGRGRSRK